ncbi:MAG: Periplasmic binding protein and sugar binding domain of LacI family [Planctomycetota bacterium]|jgi:hypothetical protein
MMPPAEPTSTRAQRLDALLAAAIADGRLAAGTPLPSRRSLAAAHRASLRTVQEALARLAGEGLVETRSGHGSRIAAAPGNRHRLGIVFLPVLGGRAPWSCFSAALAAAAADLDARCAGWDLDAAAGPPLPGAPPPPRLVAWTSMRRDAAGHRLLGVLFSGRPPAGALPPGAAPAVAIDDDPVGAPLPRLVLDQGALARLAAAALAERGCRRVAALVPPDPRFRSGHRFREACRGAGLACGDGRVLEIGHGHADGITAALAALVAHRDGPPDGLYLGDDHQVPVAAAFLRRHGRAGLRPVVCAHANAPGWSGPRDWIRVGFHAAEVIAAARDQLHVLRGGGAAAVRTVLPRRLDRG